MAHYDLGATLTSGQAFRWQRREDAWEGVVGQHWVRLRLEANALQAESAGEPQDWDWLTHYLQLDFDLHEAVRAFPDDEPMQAAVRACDGLRLLRQDPWECLASFILSSTKQIVQIQQIVREICARFGERVPTADGGDGAYSFPTPESLAVVEECELRGCKMGFRAPYLRAAAQAVTAGALDLEALATLDTAQARERLIALPGVGPKIADCVLLFAYGFQDAFPVDVWVSKALQQLYFPKRKVTPKRLKHFSQTHFGPFAGYAQQYLFHYMRTGRAGLSKTSSHTSSRT